MGVLGGMGLGVEFSGFERFTRNLRIVLREIVSNIAIQPSQNRVNRQPSSGYDRRAAKDVCIGCNISITGLPIPLGVT